VRVLADTNVFICFSRRLPLDPQVEGTLADPKTERCLSPVSIIELYRKWQTGDVPEDPDTWLDFALPAWTILPVTVPIARQSVLWTWPHKDPADRLLAATAKIEQVELWHTDTRLKKFAGFAQRYFVNRLRRTRLR
jgi:PIN domain nuclease of toxin-antitoxin system